MNSVEEKVEALLSQLELAEKVSLLSGRDTWYTVPIERLKIPSVVMTDGPHGVRSDPVPYRDQGPATSFPTGVSIASTWNRALVERVGKALGEETRAMGCDILLGPCVNIVRSPLSGRNFETYSEDPYLAGQTAIAFINGVQSQQVGTSIKHFAANNQEKERFRGNSIVDERTLREIYLPAFEMAIKQAKPWTVMCSYNRLNGEYASQNRYLLTDILKKEWGFEGAVVSDWGANHTVVESVQAGLDIEMPGPARYYGGLLFQAVQIWQIDEAVIDEAARRVLRLIQWSGKMDDPAQLPAGSVNTPEHAALAREVAEESIVLLKNDGGILPLDEKKVKSIAVIGPNATECRFGGGGSSYVVPPYSVSPLEGLKNRLGDGVRLEYEAGCCFAAHNNAEGKIELPDVDAMITHAVELAKRCDVAVIFGGMPTSYESEGDDRPDMELPGRQAELIHAVVKANPNTIVVLNVGSPVTMPWIDEVPAVLEAYYFGQEGGNAAARILLGDVNPSGKLTETFPVRLEDNPAYINYPGWKDVVYGEGIFVGYRYYDKKDVTPLFPFGHGLSYTTFKYSGLKLAKSIKAGQDVKVSLTVKNTGACEGKEVVQLYVRDVQSSLVRPLKELKGFHKVSLKPGESQVVTFTLDQRALSYYDPYQKAWVAEPGQFEVLIGSSSRDIRLSGVFELA